MHIRIATRKSALALWQTHFVKQAIQKKYPNVIVTLVEIVTEGDKQQTIPLTEIGGKALFVKALQKALLENKADIAVHSMKDMSVYPTNNLKIGAVLKRADARDAFVSQHYHSIEALPIGAKVGTASPRRSALLKAMRPDIRIELLRGNVDTRIKKSQTDEYEAVILACAGLDRLNLQQYIRERLSEENFIPAIAQGAIAIECRENDVALQEVISFLNDIDTEICVNAERAVNQVIGGDCHMAIGAHAKIMGDQLKIKAILGGENNMLYHSEIIGAKEEAITLGKIVGKMLLENSKK